MDYNTSIGRIILYVNVMWRLAGTVAEGHLMERWTEILRPLNCVTWSRARRGTMLIVQCSIL